MAIFSKNDGGLMDAIRCDEAEYLIWKWHPQGTTAKESQRANAIRWGSSLRVRDGSVAVFVYTQDNGTAQDYIEGPYDDIIQTGNFPVLASMVGTLYKGGTPFQAEVYFINLANLIQVRFGVPYFDVFDPRFTDFGVPVAVRGSLNFRIADYREFIKLHRLDDFDMQTFQTQIKDAVVRYVKSVVTNAPDKNGIPVVQMERQISEINALVEAQLMETMRKDFGVAVSRVDISDIEVDKGSAGYKKLQTMTQNKAVTFVQSAANLSDTLSTHRIGAKKIRDAVRESGRASGNRIDFGAVGQKVSQVVSDAVSGRKKGTPPPLPTDGFHVVIGGEKRGPLDTGELTRLIEEGALTADGLVWKEGLPDWMKAGEVEELRHNSALR